MNSYNHPKEVMLSGEVINQQASYGTVNFYKYADWQAQCKLTAKDLIQKHNSLAVTP